MISQDLGLELHTKTEYHQTSHIALLQLDLHFQLNTWLQWIGQRHLQDETKNN